MNHLPMRYQSQVDIRSNPLVNPVWISAGGSQAEWDVASATYAPFADIDFASLNNQSLQQIITASQQLFNGEVSESAFSAIVDSLIEGNVAVTPLTPGGGQEVIDTEMGPIADVDPVPVSWKFNGGSEEAWAVANRGGLTAEMFATLTPYDKGAVVNYSVGVANMTVAPEGLQDVIEGAMINSNAQQGSTIDQEVLANLENAFLSVFGPMEFHNSLMYNFINLLCLNLIENNYLIGQQQIEQALSYFKVLGFSNYDSELMSNIFTAVVNGEIDLLEEAVDNQIVGDGLCNEANIVVTGMHLGADAEANLQVFCDMAPQDRLNTFEIGDSSLAGVLGVSEGMLNQFMIESFGMNLADSMNINLQQAEENVNLEQVVDSISDKSIQDSESGNSKSAIESSLSNRKNIMQAYQSTRRSMGSISTITGSLAVGAGLFGLYKLFQQR